MIQLILHLIGDYITQSDWMAQNKTKNSFAAFCHALVYSLPFLLIGGWLAWLVIFSTHFAIDRWRLARFVVYAKNIWFSPAIFTMSMRECDENCTVPDCVTNRELRWKNCRDTGYPSQRPAWLAVWLLIAADNTLHLAINFAALRWL